MVGYFVIKEGWWQALLLIPLFVLVELFRERMKIFVKKLQFVGLDDATPGTADREVTENMNKFRQPEDYQGPFQPTE